MTTNREEYENDNEAKETQDKLLPVQNIIQNTEERKEEKVGDENLRSFTPKKRQNSIQVIIDASGKKQGNKVKEYNKYQSAEELA